MHGIVDKIWRNHRTDGSEYWVLCIDNERYSTWDRNHMENLQEGDAVEFAYTQSGRYRNLISLQRQPPTPTTTAFPQTPPEPAHLKFRLNCLRITAELLQGHPGLPEEKLQLALHLAKRLEQQLQEPGIKEEPREDMEPPPPPAEKTKAGTAEAPLPSPSREEEESQTLS